MPKDFILKLRFGGAFSFNYLALRGNHLLQIYKQFPKLSFISILYSYPFTQMSSIRIIWLPYETTDW